MIWLFAIEKVFDELLNLGDTCRTANEHDLINLVLLETRILQHLLHWSQGVLEKVIVDLLEASSGKGLREVLTTEMCVAVGCNDLEHTVVDCQKRHIEGATTKIVHKNVLLGLLIQAICNSCSCWLVDDTQDIHARDTTCILGRLPLCIIEVSRHSDDRMLHLLAQVVLSGLLHLDKNH